MQIIHIRHIIISIHKYTGNASGSYEVVRVINGALGIWSSEGLQYFSQYISNLYFNSNKTELRNYAHKYGGVVRNVSMYCINSNNRQCLYGMHAECMYANVFILLQY